MRRCSPPYQSQAQPSRTGYTLMEMMVVVSMTLLIAGSACMLISKMLKASHVQASTLVQQRTLHLWEDQFRQDGRLSRMAVVVADPPDQVRVEFQHPSGPVTYQVIPGGLERRVQGELGGRWESGSGSWVFSLLEGDRIVRAEHHRAEPLSLSSSGELPKGSPELPQWSRIRVDVALSPLKTGDK